MTGRQGNAEDGAPAEQRQPSDDAGRSPADHDAAGSPASVSAGVRPLLVVDAANVVGSVPDGWWRDRHAAAERLRDRLVPYAEDGLPGLPGPLEVVLVVEGAARRVPSVPGVRTVAAPAEGDDRIVEVVAEEGPGRRCVVVTADRELGVRVRTEGAEVRGPRTVRPGAGEGRQSRERT